MAGRVSRREFFQNIARLGLLAATGSVLWRSLAASDEGAPQPLGVCEQCAALRSCSRPEGRQARAFMGVAWASSQTDRACSLERKDGVRS
jgi:hypothetical protein